MNPDKVLGRMDLCDHINGNKMDARRSNLRIATPSENNYNRFRSARNKSGFKGVYLSPDGHYVVNIGVDNKPEYIGQWRSLREAAIAYNIAATDRFGEFFQPDPIIPPPLEDEISKIKTEMLIRNKRSSKKTKFYGVTIKYKRFYGEFRANNIRYKVGSYKTEEEAAKAVDNRLIELGLPPRNKELLIQS